MGYAVIIEKRPTSFGAHLPDLPGCVAAAETREHMYALVVQAIEMYVAALYVAALKEEGLPVPIRIRASLWWRTTEVGAPA